MTGLEPQSITADSLRLRPEWHAYPGSTVIWEQAADEGQGVGFDGLDPSAMLRAYFATPDTWGEVLEWYRSALEPKGWRGREVKPGTWWKWTSIDRPRETIDILDRGHWKNEPGWRIPEDRVGQLGFEVIFLASSASSARATSSDA